MKLLAFDLEVARWNEDQTNLGITCAATAFRTKSGVQYRDWYKEQPELSPKDSLKIVEDLETAQSRGWTITTVNGGAFDFKVLAETTGEWDRCRQLALNHLDLLTVVYAHRCHRLGLDAMAKGVEVTSKLKSVTLNDGSILTEMDGSKAPEMWSKGEYDAVLAYLYQDCESTLTTAQVFAQLNQIKWISKTGRKNSFKLNLPLHKMTVQWCLDNYEKTPPNWLKEYVPLPEFLGWLVP